MTNTVIQIKYSTISGNTPSSLSNGEIAINSYDGKMFYCDPSGAIQTIQRYTGPAGLNQEIQINDNGVLGSSNKLTFNKTTGNVKVSGNVTASYFIGDGSQLTGVAPAAQLYLFSNTASTISPYYNMDYVTNFSTSSPTVNSVVTIGTTGTLLTSFLTQENYPGITTIAPGQIFCQVETQKSSGVKSYVLYFELYKRTTNGVETLLLTGDTTSGITVNTKEHTVLYALVATPISLSVTDRLAVKIYAYTSSGTDTITTYWGDNTDTGLTLPVATPTIGQFVPYTNATQSLDLGTHNLTTTGNVTAGNISFDGGVITGTGSITGGSVISTSYIEFGDGSKQYTANAGAGGGGVSSVGGATGAISNTQLISFVSSAFANATFGQAAFDKANSANVLAQAAYDNSNTDLTSISISAGTFGNSSIVPVFHIESNGRISSIANSTISIDAAQIASGTIASGRLSGSYTGITGVDTLTSGTWQANSISTTYTDAKITSVGTNTGAISNTQLLDFVKSVDGTGSGLDADLLDGLNSTSFGNSVFTQAAFDNSNTDVTNISISAGIFGNSSIIPVFKVEANGRISSIANSTVSIDTSQIASGTLNSARISGEYTGITGVGTLANGTWTANSISTTYTDAKITSVGAQTGAISNTQLLDFVKAVDGTGSGLDADLLDGLNSTSFANSTFTQSAYDFANTRYASAGGTISGDVTITGNLTVSGNVVTVSANNLSIQDNMIYLNNGANIAYPDLGVVGAYSNGTYQHTGLFRDQTDGIWKFFDGYLPEPDASIYIDTSNTSFRLAPLSVGGFTATTSNVGTVLTGTWNGTSITTSYTDAKITSVGAQTGAISNTQLLDFVKAVGGSGSGLDADLLDGLNSTSFANSTFTQAAFDKANTDTTSVSITAGNYGSVSIVPVFLAEANGRISAIANATISIDASQIGSGTLSIARGGTNQTTYNNGQRLQYNGTSIASLANVTTTVTGGLSTANTISSFTVDAYGGVTAYTGAAIAIDTSQIASGTLNSDRISGQYTGITGVGTLTNGTWTANSISTTYTDAKITSVGTNTGAISNTQLLDFIKTVDGTGSGLDADLLDGLNSTSFANATFTQAAFDKANTGSGSGATITNDATSSTSRYILLTTQTSGSLSIANVSMDGLYYTPSTGTFNANNFNSLSDERFKENIQTIENSKEIVENLRGVSFNWKNTGKKSFGVIAQELEIILPELVHTNELGIKTVNYDSIIPFLVEAIKKQQKEIDHLKKEIDYVHNNIIEKDE